MQPEHGVLANQVERHFQEGRWTELESLFDSILAEDTSDARTAFRLANLLAYQARWEKATRLYDRARTYGLSGGVPLNNKGVVLACSGDSEGGVDALLAAVRLDESCAPAFYNLGILCEKLDSESSLPPKLLDLGLGEPGKRPREVAKGYYEKAGKGSWPTAEPLDGPLLLWMEDLKPGFGFVPVARIVNVDEGYDLYYQGLELIESEQWEEAISRFEGAIRLYPALQAQSRSMITYCQEQIARDRLEGIRKLWDTRDYEGASQAVDEFLAKSSLLPDRSFAQGILAAGIESLAEQIRSYKPKDGWEALQKLITQARQRFERSATDAPGDEREKASREHIRQVCRQALGRQIDYLNETGNVEAATQLLDVLQVQWFAKTDVAEWRRRVYIAQAEICRARGHDARDRKAWRDAIAIWMEGRQAAVLADDLPLAGSFDVHVDDLIGELSGEERAEAIQMVRGTGDREALRRCVEELAADPGDSRLLARREALIRQLLVQARSALEASQEEAAREIVEDILKAVPDHPEALRIFRTTQQELADRWIGQAEKAFWEGSQEEARTLCTKVLELFPNHAQARKLLREIDARRGFSPDADAYHQTYLEFIEARESGELKDAFEKALRLRELDRGAEHTDEALTWVSQALVEHLRSRLEQDRTRETAEDLLAKLKPLLNLRPDFAPALALHEELQRILDGREENRRKRGASRLEKARDTLEEAREALDEGQPEAALAALRKISKVRNAGVRQEAAALKEEALEQLRQQIDELLGQPAGDGLQEAERLTEIYRSWDAGFARARRGEIERIRRDREAAAQLDGELAELQDLVTTQADKPLDALRALDAKVRELDTAGSELLRRRRAQVLDLRRRLGRRSMSWWQRVRLNSYERSARVADLYREETE